MDRPPAGPNLAEVLDRLITLDLPLNGLAFRSSGVNRNPVRAKEAGVRIQGTLGDLYRAARRRAGRSLADAAADALLRRTHPGDCLVFTTGLVAPGIPRGETDGPAGAVALARAAILGLRVRVVLVTEPGSVAVLKAAAGALALSEGDEAGWRSRLEIQTFPTEPQAATMAARRLWADLAPSALVSVEKLGPNAQGVIHNMLGQDVTITQARSDLLFLLARQTRTLTIGIGDRGNEIGLGGLLRPAGRCGCPCGGSIACVVRAEVPVVAFSSNWGAHAVAAALAARLQRPRLLHRPESEACMLRGMVRAGAVDGVTRRRMPTVDGGGLALQTAMLGLLRAIIEEAPIRREASSRRGRFRRRPPRGLERGRDVPDES